jgi:hypothetical protein
MFKETKMSAKSSLPLVALANAKVTVAGLEINDREDFTALDTIKKVIDERERIPVFSRDGV